MNERVDSMMASIDTAETELKNYKEKDDDGTERIKTAAMERYESDRRK